MAKPRIDADKTQRLLQWLDDRYSGRGMFSAMEADSKIPAQRWKNVYYRRQNATEEMLDFVQSVSTNDRLWIVTGVRPPKKGSGYPFLSDPPTVDEQSTLGGRLIWVIKEWASPRGADLFRYLESQSQSTVAADEWAAAFLGRAKVTSEMIEVVCSQRPHFAAWVIGISANALQVDPTDGESIERWEQASGEAFKQLLEQVNQDLNK